MDSLNFDYKNSRLPTSIYHSRYVLCSLLQVITQNFGFSSPFCHNLTQEYKLQITTLASMFPDYVIPAISPQRPSIDTQNSPDIALYDAGRDLNAGLDQYAVQVLPPPNDPPTRRDWEAYRAIFTQLYRAENKPLKEVMSIMADQYGFKAT